MKIYCLAKPIGGRRQGGGELPIFNQIDQESGDKLSYIYLLWGTHGHILKSGVSSHQMLLSFTLPSTLLENYLQDSAYIICL